MVNKMALKSKVKHVTRKQISSSLKPFLKLFPSYDSATSAFVDIFSNAVTDEPDNLARPANLRKRKI